MKDKKFKFSVIIPIYNVEKYLEETILSVINQTIGFKDNIQMILVNDGSPDNSEEICLKYKELYPNNVIYVKQENAGVSAARNNGLKYAEGEYINFLDSDDVWDKEAFFYVNKMFERKNSIDVVACRIQFFEKRDGYHTLDYKFKTEQVVDIFEDYDFIQLSAASAFIRNNAIGNIRFDTKLKYSEDAKFMYEVILQKEHYGILPKAIYYYRKRNSENSAIQISHHDLSWYFDTTKLSYMYLIDFSKKKYGKVIKFIQYYIAYDFQWRLLKEKVNILTKEQQKEYILIIKDILSYIDDEIILSQKILNRERKAYFLSLKHDRDIRYDFTYNKGKIYYKNVKINSLNSLKLISINIINIDGDTLSLEGKVKDYYPKDKYRLYIKDNNGNCYDLTYFDIPNDDQVAINDVVFCKGIGFKVSFPLKDVKKFRIMIDYDKVHTRRLNFSCSLLSGLNKNIDNYYLPKGKYILSVDNNVVKVEKKKKGLVKRKERSYIKELFKLRKFKVIWIRYLVRLYRKFKKRSIWLVSDRPCAANDNGYHFFKYINSIKIDADAYFVISKKCKDYKKMKKIGKVINFDSLKYKIYFLLADKIISSQANDAEINAFGEYSLYLRNMYNYKFIFLQHGIIKDDLSKWLFKQNKNLQMFVTSVKGEYDSIVNGNYGYTKDVVKLTGLPRYDNLKNNLKNQIAIMPTWRTNLAGKTNPITGEHEYSDSFKHSEYYKFYSNLIKDERLLKCLKEHNMTGIFVVHPSHMENYIDFKGNDVFKIVEGFADYQKIFGESNLLLTDFSSVAFDFAYLNKPVIYTQFDKKSFFANQTYSEGYFEYERDGLGPVIYDYESTVNELIKYIEKGCKLDNKYKERISKFYAYHDTNNCKRVYEEIRRI